MAKNPLFELANFGQSVWIDNINRTMFETGEFKQLLADDNVTGMTSNPSIFQKAMSEGSAYDVQFKQLLAQGIEDPQEIFDRMAIKDIQAAADGLSAIFERTNGDDGYISIEVSPELAHDTEGTIAEARRLVQEVGRQNVMIKIPATKQGIPAIRTMISEGRNINITLIFSLERYREVIEAYLEGLEELAKQGKPIGNVASVASFFVSRVDTMVDKLLDEKIKQAPDEQTKAKLRELQSKAAIANAKMAYKLFQEYFEQGTRFAKLKEKGARVQRPLWASTSTKNPALRDVLYVEELIGPHTVDTMPKPTVDAFKEHGIVRLTVTQNVDQAEAELQQLEDVGISMAKVTQDLEDAGVKQFADAFTSLRNSLKQKAEELKKS